MTEIRVTFGELAAAQQNVTATSTRIQGQLEDLRRMLAPLAAGWTGAAAEGYQAKQREVDLAWEEMTRVLGQIGVRLGHAEQIYRTTEMHNRDRYA